MKGGFFTLFHSQLPLTSQLKKSGWLAWDGLAG
jgi:hypothetical protein